MPGDIVSSLECVSIEISVYICVCLGVVSELF